VEQCLQLVADFANATGGVSGRLKAEGSTGAGCMQYRTSAFTSIVTMNNFRAMFINSSVGGTSGAHGSSTTRALPDLIVLNLHSIEVIDHINQHNPQQEWMLYNQNTRFALGFYMYRLQG
jgi:hypothetical protein